MASTDPLITVEHVRDATTEIFDDTNSNDPELKQLQFFIRFASGKARQRVRRDSGRDLDAGLADGSLDRDLMIGVMVVAVMRALESWRRGMGVKTRQFPEEMTEYTENASSASLVYFTDDEISDLTPNPSTGGLESGAFSISPSYAPDNRPGTYRPRRRL
ncbi:MAG: hypothetical protein WBD41_14290 [Rhodococcus sp. (in: high G+C Gram-positive bacteria)]